MSSVYQQILLVNTVCLHCFVCDMIGMWGVEYVLLNIYFYSSRVKQKLLDVNFVKLKLCINLNIKETRTLEQTPQSYYYRVITIFWSDFCFLKLFCDFWVQYVQSKLAPYLVKLDGYNYER